MVLTSTHNLCFEQKNEEYQNFLSEYFHFLVVKLSVYLNRHVFVMSYPLTESMDIIEYIDSEGYDQTECIAPLRQIRGTIHIIFFLISPRKHMLWVLIRSASVRCF